MAMSNAERQRRYRERHLKNLEAGAERINVVADLQAKLALERLARYWGLTQRATLELVLSEAQRQVLDGLTGEEQNKFYDGKLKKTDVTT